MTKSTITREESVQAVFDLKVGYRLGFADIEILKRVARMALAAMDSEPVIIVGDDSGDALSYRRLLQSFAPGTKLYRHAQPAPVVPDAATAIRACLFEFPESARDIVEECADIAENACHSSMLQAEPVTTTNNLGNSLVIPDGWKVVPPIPTNAMYLATNGKDSLTEKYIAMIDAAPELPGLEPASFLDTWIPVSERMPEDEQEVLTRNRMGHRFVSFFDKHSGLFFDRLDAPAACCIEHVLVTHWMPLPAAPQEVKGE